jgi:hypothetical protein
LHSVAAYERVCKRGAKSTVLNVLLDLPDEISRPVVLGWLCLKHMVRLDSALINRNLRGQYFSLMYGQLVTFPVNSYRQQSDYTATLAWITARSVRPDGICVLRSCKSSEQLLEKLTVNSGAAVRWIDAYSTGSECEAYQQLLQRVAERCPEVQRLLVNEELKIAPWGDTLLKLVQEFQRLTELVITDLDLSQKELCAVLRHCKYLEALSIRDEHQHLSGQIALPTLRSLEIYSRHMSDAIMVAIGQRCTRLELLKCLSRSSSSAAITRSPMWEYS